MHDFLLHFACPTLCHHIIFKGNEIKIYTWKFLNLVNYYGSCVKKKKKTSFKFIRKLKEKKLKQTTFEENVVGY